MKLPYNRLRSVSFGLAVTLSVIVLFRPGGTGPLPFPQADKVIHIVTFALLAITAWWRFAAQPSSRGAGGDAAISLWRLPHSLRSLAMTDRIIVALIGYALASEAIQHFFVPRRGFDVFDIAADLAGTFGILFLFRHPRPEAQRLGSGNS